MPTDTTIFNESKTNASRTDRILSIDQLKTHVRLIFSSDDEAGREAGLTGDRVRQILNGFDLPKTPALIEKIAHSWGFNPVTLALIFSNHDNKLREETK